MLRDRSIQAWEPILVEGVAALALDLGDGRRVLIDVGDRVLVEGRYVHVRDYARIGRVFLHRTIKGTRPGDRTHTDHRNGDALDNRRCNLRVTTPQRNQANRKRLNRNNTSGVRGVSAVRGGRWAAHIMVNRRKIHLGQFSRVEDAARVRRQAEITHFGEACP